MSQNVDDIKQEANYQFDMRIKLLSQGSNMFEAVRAQVGFVMEAGGLCICTFTMSREITQSFSLNYMKNHMSLVSIS